MSILFRYILREFLNMFIMCFAASMTVYLIVDFFERLRRFLRHDAEVATIVEYFALKMPFIAFQVTPFAVLMATLLTLGLFARNHEITAMRSCGISLFRISLPFLTFALLVSGLLLWFSTVVVPVTATKADYIIKTRIEKKTVAATFKAERPWVRIGNQTLMSLDMVEPEGRGFRGVTLYRLSPTFQLTSVIQADALRYTAEGWRLQDGIERVLQADGAVRSTAFTQRAIDLPQAPEEFQGWLQREPDEMTIRELGRYITRLGNDGYNVGRLLTDYHGRLASPFVAVVMVVVGVALSQRRTGARGAGMAIGIGQALLLGFLYWTTYSIAISLGRTGVLAPIMAGWLANLLFVSFGMSMLLAVRH